MIILIKPFNSVLIRHEFKVPKVTKYSSVYRRVPSIIIIVRFQFANSNKGIFWHRVAVREERDTTYSYVGQEKILQFIIYDNIFITVY